MTRAIRISADGLIDMVEDAALSGWKAEPNDQARLLDKFGTDEPYPVLLARRDGPRDPEQRNDLATAIAVPLPYREEHWIAGDVYIVGEIFEDLDWLDVPERVTVEEIVRLTEFFADH